MQFFTQITLSALLCILFSIPSMANNAYPDDENLPVFSTMTVTESSQRFPFSVDEEKGIIRLCNLEVGEEYSIMLTPEEFQIPCVFELNLPSDQSSLLKKPTNNQVKAKLRYFTATSDCMDFNVSNLNCNPDQKYQLWASLLCESCEKSTPGYLPDFAPISIGGGLSSFELVEGVFIAGGCFEVTNVQPIGDASGRGTFSNGLTTVNMEDGIILSSGDVTNALGPNGGTGTSTNFGDSSGDQDLDLLGAGAAINDAVGIQFIVEPTVDQIIFEYAFASEEYCDFVGSQFNDVFGFFISGLGITGGFTGGADNIAVLPGTGTFVAINSVNHITNSEYFNANSPTCALPAVAPNDIEYDGYTTVLTAVANVVPCRQYNIRLVVADAGDHIYDSAVFLKANSFQAGGTASLDFDVFFDESTGAAYEGCSDGQLIFERIGFDTSEPISLPVNISPLSTATEGVDFSFLPDSIVIPAGQTTVILPFTIFDDGILEGQETLTVYIENTCECGGSIIALNITDNLPIDIVIEDDIYCGPQAVTISPTISGGIPEFTYQWSTGDVTEELYPFVTETTTYTVTVSDACGNESESSGTIQVNQPSFASFTGSGLVCPENPNQPISLQVDFVGPGPWQISYSIDGVPQPPIDGILQNPYMLQATQPGNYQLTGVFSQGCEGVAVGFATVNVEAIGITEVVTEVTCAGYFDGAIDIFPSGGTFPYTFEWDYGSFEQNLWGLGPGDYTVTITDLIGCTQVMTIPVFSPDELEADISIIDVPTCVDPTGGSVDLSISGGREFYTILWDDGSFQENRSDLEPGTYYVTVIDFMGCTVEDSIVVDGVIDLPTPIAEVNNTINCTQTMATLSAGNSSGTGNLLYQWLNPDGTPLSTLEDVDVGLIGTYTLVVTDESNNCSAETTVDVAQNILAPQPIAEVSGGLSCSDMMVMLDGSMSTGIGNLTYQWFDPSSAPAGSTPDLNVSTQGTYTLIITDDANGCTAETTVTVDQDIAEPLPDAQASGILTCTMDNVTLDGSGSSGGANLNYQWFNPANAPIGTNSTVSVATMGTYTLIVTNQDNGCTAQTTVDVNQDINLPLPDAQVSGMLTCTDLQATLDGSNSTGIGTLQYQWFDGATPVGSGAMIDVGNSGTYTLLITDMDNGCTAETTVDVDQNINEPIPDAQALGVLTCADQMVTLDGGASTGNGTLTYEWFDGTTSLGTGNTVDVDAMGTYTLLVTSQANGCTAETTVDVNQNLTPPTVDAGNPATLSCGTTSASLMGSGNGMGTVTYEWLNPGGVSVGTGTSLNATESGIYTLIALDDANGCTAEATVEVDVDEDVPEVDLPLPEQLTCGVLSVDLDASGSTGTGTLEFNWTDDNDVPLGTDPMLTVSDAGTYTLVLTDPANGCTAEATVEVAENLDEPSPTAAVNGILTCQNEMVELNASGSSGAGSLTYVWFNESNTQVGTGEMIDVGDPGTYTLVITDDANGCTSSTPITVDQNEDLPTPVALASGELTCAMEMIELDASSSTSTGTLLYNWISPTNVSISSDPQIDVNIPGTYTLVITDQTSGCTAEVTVPVIQDIIAPTADAGNGGILSCSSTFVPLNGDGSSNGMNIDYEWFNPSNVSIGNDVDIDVTESGTYTLVVTNTTNGCTSSSTVTVTPDSNLPTVDIVDPMMLDCDVLQVNLDASGSTANGTLSFAWVDENNMDLGDGTSIMVGEPGNYTLVITDENNGCTAESTVEVLENVLAPPVDAIAQGMLTCLDFNTVLEAQTTGTLDYNWLDPSDAPIGNNSSTVTVGSTGIYTLIVTDPQNGCTNSTQVEVFEDINAPISIATASDMIDCITPNIDLSANGSSGIGNLTYTWFNDLGQPIGSDPNIAVAAAGTYELFITDDANGCTSSAFVEVFDDFNAPTADAGANDILTCQNSQVTLNGSASSGGNNFEYQWLNDQGTEVGTMVNLDVTQSGTYTLVVTNTTNGCTATDEAEVSPDTGLPTPDAAVLNVINCLNATAMIDGSASTGNGTLTYDWRNDLGTSIGADPTLEVTAAGNYTLILTDQDNGCTAELSVPVLEDFTDPVALTGNDELLTCQTTQVMLSGGGSSAGGDFAYQWFNPSNVEIGADIDVIVTEVGTYTLVVTNTTNGCTAEASVAVIPDVGIPTPAVAQSGILTCTTGAVTLDGSGSIGTGQLDYQWLDDTQGLLGSNDNIELADPGIYTLVITDTGNGCSAEMTVEILQDIQDPIADAGTGGTISCEQNQWPLMGDASSTGIEFSYQWLDENNQEISTDQNAMASTAGTYTLIVTNVLNGCTQNATVTVSENFTAPLPDIATPQLLTCTTLDVDLDANNSTGIDPLIYEWQAANGTILGTDPILNVTTTGEYTLIITDPANGCTAMTQTTVNDDLVAPISIAGNGGTLTCDALNVSLDGTNSSNGNNISYEWFNAGNVTVGTNAIVSVTEVGVYTLVVTNTDNGCTATSSAEVIPDSNLPTALAEVSEALTCSVPMVNLDGSMSSNGMGITYIWLDPANAVLTNDQTIDVNEPGTYTLVVTDTNNGCSASFSVEVDQDITEPVADAGADAVITCQIPTVQLDASNSSGTSTLQYEWISPAGTSAGTTPTLEVASPGIYQLIVTAENGCTNEATVEVILDADVPVADPGEGGTLTCLQSLVSLGGDLTSTGNTISYEWIDINNNVVGNTKTIDVANPGIYTLIVNNSSNNCSSSSMVEVLQNITTPIADPGIASPLNCATLDWTIGGTGTTTGANISYQWQASDGAVLGLDANLVVTTPDVYTLVVTNTESGCTAEESIEVFQNLDTPQADAGPSSVLTCAATTALLDGSSSSQGGNIAYQWLDAAGIEVGTTINLEVAQSGVYTLVVTNTTSNCTSTANVTITPDANLPTADAGTGGTLTCAVGDVMLNGGASSTINGNINYSWQNDQGTEIGTEETLMVTTPGIYTLFITDPVNGCSNSALVEVFQDIEPPVADAGQPQILTCSQTTVSLTGTGTNGTNLVYEWLDADGMSVGSTANVDVSIAGNYTLVVTNNDNGCSAMSTVAVTPDTNLPIADAGIDAVLNCNTEQLNLSGTNSTAGPNIQYEWQNAAGQVIGTSPIVPVNEAGQYTLFVTNTMNNCFAQDIVVITDDFLDPVPEIIPLVGLQIDCNNSSLVLNSTVGQAGSNIIYTWSDVNGNIISATNEPEVEVNAAGQYILQVTNQDNGCSAETTIAVLEDLENPIADIGPADLLDCNITEVQLSGANSSTQGNFTYDWTAMNGTGIVSGTDGLSPIVNATGTYTLTVINEDNGCVDTDNVTVAGDFVSPIAVASVNDELDCITDAVMISGTGSSTGAGFTYAWSGNGIIGGGTGLSPEVNQSGNYTLVVTNEENGCTEEDNVLVLENTNVPNNISFSIGAPPCFGENGSAAILSVSGGEGPYLYAIDGTNFFPDTAFTQLAVGTYDVIVQDAIGCEHTESFVIPETPELNVDVEPEVTISLGESHELLANINIPNQLIDTIFWTPTDSLSCTDCLDPIANPTETTLYEVTVINENGCITTDMINLIVRKDRNIFIPNAFSPDDRGENNIFFINSDRISVDEITSFQVFSRWGELVFEDNGFQPDDPSHGWDGTFRGERLDPAVFVYWAEIRFIDGTVKLYKGDVTLMK